MFGFYTQEGVKAVWDRHFTNVSVEIGVTFECVWLPWPPEWAYSHKFFALQALLDVFGYFINKLDLKDPISLNWVRFRPGICDGGACSSTDSWACERTFTRGCLGFTPKRGSKQCGIDILPMFLLRLGSNLRMCMAPWPPEWTFSHKPRNL